MVRVVGAVLALATSAAAHALLGVALLVGPCAVSDTATRRPAPASWQGWACGSEADSLWQVPGAWVLLVSTLLAAAAAVAVARGAGGVVRRVVGAVAALAAVLALTAVALVVPPDACTEEQRREHTAYECDTTTES